MSPQVKYSLYKDTYNLIQREIVGTQTVNGISFANLKEALTKGNYLLPKYNKTSLMNNYIIQMVQKCDLKSFVQTNMMLISIRTQGS